MSCNSIYLKFSVYDHHKSWCFPDFISERLGSKKGRSVPSHCDGGTVNLWTVAFPVGSNLWDPGEPFDR